MTNHIAVQLVTAPGCTKCEEIKATITGVLNQLRSEYPIEFTELSLPDYPELTAEYEIWTTPTEIINGELAFSGRVNEQALRDKLAAVSQSLPSAT
ncbi:hypothetical protein BH23CHL5_BH23CHL5_24930 [soil metagenome]